MLTDLSAKGILRAVARVAGRTRERTHDEALAAARRAFAAHGFDGASLSTIAKAAGVSAATLCHHFGDKRGLYDAVTDALYASLGQLEQSIDPTLPLAGLIEAIYRFAEDNRDALRFMLRDVVQTGRVDERVRQLYMGPSLDRVSGLLARQFEVSEQRARETMVALNHMLVRFVTNSDEDNALSMGVTDVAEARRRVIALLVAVARGLLGQGTEVQRESQQLIE